jgi:hypothetical protein
MEVIRCQQGQDQGEVRTGELKATLAFPQFSLQLILKDDLFRVGWDSPSENEKT